MIGRSAWPAVLVVAALALAPDAHAGDPETSLRVGYDGAEDRFVLEPAGLRVGPGDTVTFVNPADHGSVPGARHTLTCLGELSDVACPSPWPVLEPGTSRTVTVGAEEGVMWFQSIEHRELEGYVIIQDVSTGTGAGGTAITTPAPQERAGDDGVGSTTEVAGFSTDAGGANDDSLGTGSLLLGLGVGLAVGAGGHALWTRRHRARTVRSGPGS